MEIKSLKDSSFESIYKAFSKAFADYEIQLNQHQLAAMLRRRGFSADVSFAAFNEEQEIVAFTLNGIGIFNGMRTAYDTGTGTIKEYRGQALAGKIFEYSIPFLKAAGVQQYLLEVLQHNAKAISVYRKLGFEVSREFNYFVCQNEDISLMAKSVDGNIRPITFEQLKSVVHFTDFNPSWQNSLESIERVKEVFIMLGAYRQDELIGYCVFEPGSGDITQLAVPKEFRRQGIGSALLQEALKHNEFDSVKVINTEISCDSINGFLSANNIEASGQQFEMIKRL